jgi:hypothetical protein
MSEPTVDIASASKSKDSDLVPMLDSIKDLNNWLGDKSNSGRIVQTRLKTSDRVIARVTDGIYRQPASAIRELISNAWDADANEVTILTDAPRFSRIYVKDDGLGMSYETLSRLVHSIGGSAKRQDEGKRLGVTSADDPDRTPGGRLLIGKIGIGLFSVSQLARHFRIITKVKGNDYRLIADVSLRAYSEDEESNVVRDDDDRYISGTVLITREDSSDLEAHGTDIILDAIKPRVRDLLRSADRWRALDEKKLAEASGDLEAAANIRVDEPRYHVGWMAEISESSKERPAVLSRDPVLPWDATVPAEARMSRLIDAIEGESTRLARPDLASTLDSYLETIWTLALSLPVGYVDKHPFDLTEASGVGLYWISNEARGQAIELKLSGSKTVREAVREQVPGNPQLEDGLITKAGTFRVNIDGIELKRPIRFKLIKSTSRGFEKPVLFVGRYSPNLEKVDPNLRGGAFGLEGYLLWNGLVIPKENNGVLVRIRGAAGALFDQTFFKYQISEQTRLRQITSEIFIKRGLDAALNIDRESFNFSHPHVQFLGIWLHKAIRQLTNKAKDLGKKARSEKLEQNALAIRDIITARSEDIWAAKQGSEVSPEVKIADTSNEAELARSEGFMAVNRAQVPILQAASKLPEKMDREIKAMALLRILAAYGALDNRPYEEQQSLLQDILQIFFEISDK